MFPAHTLQTAPPAARPAMRTVQSTTGTVPDAVRRLAGSPELLNGFLAMSAAFEGCTLDPLAREVVIMTVAVRNDCHVCIAMHTGKLRKLGASPEIVSALRAAGSLPDARLEAIRVFTLELLATAGGVDDASVTAFTAHGYTERNALEVVFGIGTYTMSTLANRLVRAA
ncbi:carboxymuconolactone decarboxylase family protein [Nocardia sp. NPDC004568]|uniref:carboxymuconolactone decarboxylase family protein n=1 Tax=Nocardia sp. NPDC004568 TaxID=3154551 RepID=UPI0033B143AA